MSRLVEMYNPIAIFCVGDDEEEEEEEEDVLLACLEEYVINFFIYSVTSVPPNTAKIIENGLMSSPGNVFIDEDKDSGDVEEINDDDDDDDCGPSDDALVVVTLAFFSSATAVLSTCFSCVAFDSDDVGVTFAVDSSNIVIEVFDGLFDFEVDDVVAILYSYVFFCFFVFFFRDICVVLFLLLLLFFFF